MVDSPCVWFTPFLSPYDREAGARFQFPGLTSGCVEAEMARELTFIGAAFPRTGTMSTKKALESLGVGQIYHMHEVSQKPDHIPQWAAIPGGC